MMNIDYRNSIEYQKAINFLKVGCNCGCSEKVPHEEFAKIRAQFKSLSKPAQDAFVMGQLLNTSGGKVALSKRLKNKKRNNLRNFYRWDHNIFLCQKTYFNMIGVSRKYLEILVHELTHQGLAERVHGNTGRMPRWKTKKFIDENVKQTIRNFIENYAEKHGSPKSERTKRANKLITLLPTEMTYKSVHQEFSASLEENNQLKSLKYRTFLKLWHNLTPHIKFLNPRTDLCNTCHEFRSELHSCQDETEVKKVKKNLIPSRKN